MRGEALEVRSIDRPFDKLHGELMEKGAFEGGRVENLGLPRILFV